MRQIQNAVCNRVLELTIEPEKALPTAVDVKLGESGVSIGVQN